MRLAFAICVAVVLGAASPALACRIAVNRPPPTQEAMDAALIQSADVTALGIVTLSAPESEDVQVEIRTTESLRGESPQVIKGGPEIIIIGCSGNPPMQQILSRLSAGDEVLVFAKWMGEELMLFNIMRTEDVQAARLIALLRASPRPSEQ